MPYYVGGPWWRIQAIQRHYACIRTSAARQMSGVISLRELPVASPTVSLVIVYLCLWRKRIRIQEAYGRGLNLKELSIRGDFRTAVEYLMIKLLETPAFEENTIPILPAGLTSWSLTSWLHRAHLASEARACIEEYRKGLQVLSKEVLKTPLGLIVDPGPAGQR